MADVATAEWSLPEHWWGWPHGDPSRPEPMSSPHGLGDHGRERVLAAVSKFDILIDRDLPGTSLAALWAPPHSNGEPVACAVLRVFASTPAVGPRVEAVLERARTEVTVPPGVRLLDVAALPGAVTAGDAVVQIVDTATRFRRRVTREWSWFILAPGTDDLVLVHVESSSVAHFDALADMATDIANSVELTLART